MDALPGLSAHCFFLGVSAVGFAASHSSKVATGCDCCPARGQVRANFRPRYLTSLRQYLNLFARGREDWLVAAITVCTVEEWFASRIEALTTQRANMGRLASLFTFCVRRGWMALNPCDALDKARLDPKPPRILSVEEARTVLTTCRAESPKLMPWLALGLFCGLRPEEAEQCAWTR